MGLLAAGVTAVPTWPADAGGPEHGPAGPAAGRARVGGVGAGVRGRFVTPGSD